MKISFDIHPLLVPNKSGISHYAEQVIQSFIRQFPDNEYYLDFFALKGKQEKLKKVSEFLKQYGLEGHKNIRVRACGYFSKGVYKMVQAFLPIPYAIFFPQKADAYYFFNYIAPPFVPGKIILAVYDLGFKDYPQTINFKTKMSLRLNFKSSLKRASTVLTISEFSKERLLHHFDVKGKPVAITYCGVDTNFFKREPDISKIEAVKDKYGISGGYFLFIGTIEPRKNLEKLMEAYSLFAEETPNPPSLVLSGGRGWLCEGIYEAAGRVQKGRVIFTGYVEKAEIPVLLSGAVAFCFPSLYEGFGLPVLEAMACGTPVLTSNTSSLPEVAGGAAAMADKDDAGEIKAGMVKLYWDEGYRKELTAKGYENVKRFNWDDVAGKCKKACPLGTGF